MKKIIILLITIIFFSCKKETVIPVSNSAPVCQTLSAILAGKYVGVLYQHPDTIEFVFNGADCSYNSYTIKKLGEAVQSVVNSGQTFPIQDYNIIVDETIHYGTYKQANVDIFQVYYVNNDYTHWVPQIQIQCNKLQYQPVTFKKL